MGHFEQALVLRPDWETHIQPVTRPATRHLRLCRPATLDLILTKMMRGADEQDMEDVVFLMEAERVSIEAVEAAFQNVSLPDVPELREAFERAKPAVRDIVRNHS